MGSEWGKSPNDLRDLENKENLITTITTPKEEHATC
jgi:hypothetical protein